MMPWIGARGNGDPAPPIEAAAPRGFHNSEDGWIRLRYTKFPVPAGSEGC
jgi:hypothetical protein